MENSLIDCTFQDIPSYFEWISIEQINKGWSKDKKYHIKNNIGENFLLRISDFDVYEIKKKEFESMQEVYKLGADAGKILRKMHTIPDSIGQEDWEERMIKKISNHLMRYEKCGIKVLNDDTI